MRIFTIDQGNTHSSIVCWENNRPTVVDTIEDSNAPVIASNVGKNKSPNKSIDLSQVPDLFSKCLLDVKYCSSLGTDRLMAAIGARILSPQKQNILIIDAGTFTTIDTVKGNQFLGGLIIPGDTALSNNYAQGSNLYPSNFNLGDYPFHSTQDCMTKSIPFVLEATYQKIISSMDIGHIFISGGNQAFHIEILKKVVQSKIDITVDSILVHRGVKYFYDNHLRNNNFPREGTL